MLENLYNALYSDGRYTKSFEEFQKQFEDASYRERVYENVTSTGEYTNMFSDFETKYYTPSFQKEEVSEVNQELQDYLPSGDILQNYLRQLEQINITQEEMDDITSRAGEDAKLVYREDTGEGGIIGLRPFEQKLEFPYQKFLNEEQTNHTEAQQKWIDEEREKLIVEKTENILNEFEDEVSPLWEDLKGAALKFTGRGGFRPTTQAQKEYKSGTEYLTAEFNKKYKVKEANIVKASNDLRVLSETINKIDFDMSAIEDIYKNNQSDLTEGEVEAYNTFINTRKSLVESYNYKLKNLNSLEAEASDIATIGDLTKRTYNNFDILENRLGSTALRLGSGLVKLTKEIAGAGERIEDVDYNSLEFLATMPEYLRPIVSGYGTALDKLDTTAKNLYNEAEKINEYTARRQEFGDVKSIGDFGMFMLDLMSEQAINTTITYSTGGLGLAIISAGASGNKMSEMDVEIEKGRHNPVTGKMEDIKISPLQYYTSAIGYGLAEYVTERVALENLKYGIKNYKKAFG